MSGSEGVLAWLASEAGQALLAEAEQMPTDRLTRLTRLRRHAPVERATGAVELLELRKKARAKFSQAEKMFFTPEGLEQATGENIARYRANRFPSGVPVLDVCSGIGGDAMALAERGPVMAVDCNPAAAMCTRLNSQLVPASIIHTLCADVTKLEISRLQETGMTAAFFDPSRRTDNAHGGRRRIRSAEDYSPPLHWLETLHRSFPELAVKVSPALEDAVLGSYPASVEFLSDRGECKEAVLWFGSLGVTLTQGAVGALEGYFATVLRPHNPPATLTPFPCELPSLSPPRTWLYEPDPAVIRAHLVPQIASLLQATQLSPQIAYLTSDIYQETPFATAYRVLDWLPYNLKHIQAKLRELGGRIEAVKKRGVPFEPEEIRKKLPPAGDTPLVLILSPHREKPIALLTEVMPS